MTRALFYFVFLFYSQDLLSQDKLGVYKKKVDSVVAQRIDKYLLTKINLVSTVLSAEDPGKTRFVDFNKNKDKKLNFSSATFFFEFYYMPLNYKFWFHIKIDNDRNILPDSASFAYIPVCVLKNEECNFISSDSAKKIAIKDSILYSDNLKTELIPEYKKDGFYWLVSGSPKKEKKSEGISNKPGKRQRRLIDVRTGAIMPL